MQEVFGAIVGISLTLHLRTDGWMDGWLVSPINSFVQQRMDSYQVLVAGTLAAFVGLGSICCHSHSTLQKRVTVFFLAETWPKADLEGLSVSLALGPSIGHSG